MKIIKKFNIFTLAIILFFETIFSASANNTILLNPPIFEDDIGLLQRRLNDTFEGFNPPGAANQYLIASMYTHEKLKESGSEDYFSRTVRFYSLPALFGDENRPSALISDFYSMMSAANVYIKDVFDHFDNGRQHINEENSETFKSKCENFCVAVSDGIKDPTAKLIIRYNAYSLMAMFLKSFIIKDRREIPSWWDGFFHTKETEDLIRRNKTISNIFEVSLLLVTAIKEKEWKYTDENGQIQYNDFLVTATDETTEKPYLFPPFRFPFHFIWGTTLNPDRDVASVKFVKSNPPLYQIDVDLQQQLLRKYERLYGEIWRFLNQFRIPESSNVVDEINYIHQNEIGEVTVWLQNNFEGITGSIISALSNLDQNERAEFGREWQALLESFNANWSNSQRTQNILGNLRNNMTEARARIVFLHRIVSDLTNEYNNQSQINRNLQRQLAAANERLEVLEAHEQNDSNAFRANIEQAYRNGNWVVKRCLKALFPNVLRDIDNVNGRSGLQCVVTQ